jgi:hypothetical protein
MKSSLLVVLCSANLFFATLFSATRVEAALLDRGGGLIYDTELDVTWLMDANYAITSGFDADGLMPWATAMSWVASLSYYDSVRDRTWTDWRLPSAIQEPGSGPCFGFFCRESEMGHLYSVEGIRSYSPGPFVNLLGISYWSNTGNAPLPGAWLFHLGIGKQDYTGSLEERLDALAWPVRNGDVALPECSDGMDNDGDGWIDYPADPQCLHPSGNSEAPGSGVCGLGFELALPLLALMRLRGTRRRAAT